MTHTTTRSSRSAVLLPLISVPLIVALLGACGPGEPESEGTSLRTIVDAESVCADCVSMTELAVLGDTTGPGFLVESNWATVDHAGNYWIGQYAQVKVFGPDGGFVQTVGRAGEGPLEFSGFTAPTFTDAEGRVHIIDFGNPRETIVLPSFELHETRRLPGYVQAATPLGGGDRLAVAMSTPGPDDPGHPLHIVEGSELLHSFGRDEADTDQHPALAQRVLATGPSGRVFSAHKYDYVVEVWDEEGQLLEHLQGLELNGPDLEFGPWSADNPPAAHIESLRIDQSGRLWILIIEPRDDWLDHTVEQVLPDGRTTLVPEDDLVQSLFRTRLEIVDLDEAELVARMYLNGLFAAFLDDDLIIGLQSTPTHVPQLGMWRLEFN